MTNRSLAGVAESRDAEAYILAEEKQIVRCSVSLGFSFSCLFLRTVVAFTATVLLQRYVYNELNLELLT